MKSGYQEPKEEKKITKGNLLKLVSLMLPYKGLFTVCILLTITVNLADLVKPYLLKIIIDDFLDAGLPQHGVYSITGLGITYFGMTLIGAFCALSHTRLINRICHTLLHDMRLKVYKHISKMSLTSFDQYSSGRLLTRATNDVETISEFYSDVVVNLLKDVVLLIGIAAMMLVINWRLALVGFVTVPFIFLITFTMRKILKRNFKKQKYLIGRINAFFSENIDGMKTVKAFNREQDKLREFEELDGEYFKTSLLQVKLNSILRPMMEVVNSIGIALLLVYGFYGVSGSLMEVGVVYAFTTYVKKFFQPINDLADKYQTIQSATVSADRIFEILDDAESQEQLDSGTYRERCKGKIEFRNVWFAYENENWVLKDVSFVVQPGQKVAFIGPTGAGKTTIINLISGFYFPQKGQILIDDVPISEWNLGILRENVCVVLQEVFLFAGSIAENIALSSDIPREKIERAVTLSAADSFIQKLPDGLDTRVAERGGTFSAGERQLLSFARAIVHDPAILVLDEATANIDSNTEQVIQKSIADISRGRTAAFIAHRLSTIRSCDCIYVVNAGQIVEQGNHEELTALGGIYCEWSGRVQRKNEILQGNLEENGGK